MVNFYSYKDAIVNEMEKNGYSVDWFSDTIKLNVAESLFSLVFPIYKRKKFDRYFKKTISNKKYDLVVIVFGGFYFREKHISILREAYQGTPIVYYAWDSVKNFPHTEELIKSCDKAFTFDEDDAKHYSIPLLPLFYIEKASLEREKKYKISIIATLFNKKIESINKVVRFTESIDNKYVFLKVKSKLHAIEMRIKNDGSFKGIKKYCSYQALSHREMIDVFEQSIAVVDFPIPNQTGLTIRTFEALALKCKVITTNANIKNYDFYTPNNILIIDDSTKEIPSSFFDTPFDESKALGEKYSIDSFVKTLLR